MRIVLVHGFTQTAASWEPVEAPWRGTSLDPRAIEIPDALDFVTTAAAIGDRGGPATYVGYSMGGRLCLQLALDRPEMVERLVLVSASPGIADPSQRAARRESDEQLAQEVEREGVHAFVKRWLAQPMFATLSRDAAGLGDRVGGNTAARLAHQLRALGQGSQPSNWSRLHELTVPSVLFVGSRDAKYTSIAEEMAAPMRAHLRVMSGQGHACHLENPGGFAHVLASWLGIW
jgi:2-succinyl-6-hydroxy-2,4-cyclohexadiene-1-carboxylate synthase